MPANPQRRGPTFARKPRVRPRAVKGEVLLDEKAQRRVRRMRARRIAIVLGFAGLVGALVALYFSPLTRVQDVQVQGTALVSAEEVLRLADVEGESMLTLNTADVQQRVQQLALVQSVKVERHLPRSVRIIVTERAPWGVWQAGDNTYVIDAEGVVLPGVAAPPGAPVIRDLSGPLDIAAGERVDRDSVLITQQLVQLVPERLGVGLTALEFSPATGLTLTTDAGYRVVIGDSQNIDFKLAVWKELEAQVGREAMSGQVLDLRFGDRPVLANPSFVAEVEATPEPEPAAEEAPAPVDGPAEEAPAEEPAEEPAETEAPADPAPEPEPEAPAEEEASVQ